MPSVTLNNKGKLKMQNFADLLISEIGKKGNPCVVGLDYHENRLPEFVSNLLKRNPTPATYRDAIGGFFKQIIETIAPIVPAVKPQMSLLESLTYVGAQIFMDVVQAAKESGLIIIADAKRSDISSSALGYANAFLGSSNKGPAFTKGYDTHAMTVNPFLGRDSLEPYLNACQSLGKGIFVLVKTSNKGSVETQDVMLQNPNEPIFSLYGRMVNEIGASVIGKSGYSSVGAVVGATFPEQARLLRELMPKTIILVPGYGAQGASADDAAWNFNQDGLGAVVNASRSISYAFDRPDISPKKYVASVKENVLRMADDIVGAIHRKINRYR